MVAKNIAGTICFILITSLCVSFLLTSEVSAKDCYRLWDSEFCTPDCKCSFGQGDCDEDADCISGLYCKFNVGDEYGSNDPTDDVCVSLVNGCHRDNLGGEDYCSENCKCGEGEGDCKNDDECKTGLVCGSNNGADFGFKSTVDVCVKPTNGCHATYNGGKSYCSSDCKCGNGEGPCSFYNTQCKENHECVSGFASQFGLRADMYVCIKGSPKCVPRWVCTDDGNYRQWKDGYCNKGTKQYCPDCYRGECRGFNCEPEGPHCKNDKIVTKGTDCGETVVEDCEFGCNNGDTECKKTLCEPESYCTGSKTLYTRDENCKITEYKCFDKCEDGSCVCFEEKICLLDFAVEKTKDCKAASFELCEYGCENGVCKQKSKCTAGWECIGDNYKLYKNAECEWTEMEPCPNGCENGACKPAEVCSTGWECKDSDTKHYRNSDCTYTLETDCENGCENGQCRQKTCTPGWECKDDNTKYYKNVDCSYSSPVTCQYGCENGACKAPSCTTQWTCKDSTYRGYQYTNCNWGGLTKCKFGCKGNNCRTEEQCIADGDCQPKCEVKQYCDGYKSITIVEDCTKQEVPCLYGCSDGRCQPESTNLYGWKCKDGITKGYYIKTGEWISTERCRYGCYDGRCQTRRTANCNNYEPWEGGFCSRYCQCGYGQGPCKSDNDCARGFTCLINSDITEQYNLEKGQGICGGFVNTRKLTYTGLLRYFKDDKFSQYTFLTPNSRYSGLNIFDNNYRTFSSGGSRYKITLRADGIEKGAHFADAPATCKAKWEAEGFDAALPTPHLNFVLQKSISSGWSDIYNGHFALYVKKTGKSKYCLVWYITKVKRISDADQCGIQCMKKPEFDMLKRPPALPVDVPQAYINYLATRMGALHSSYWPQAIPGTITLAEAGEVASGLGYGLVYVIGGIYTVYTGQLVGSNVGVTNAIPGIAITDINGYGGVQKDIIF